MPFLLKSAIFTRKDLPIPTMINSKHAPTITKVKVIDFKKAVNWQCQTPARSCQHFNFCFPCKKNSTDQEASTEKPILRS